VHALVLEAPAAGLFVAQPHPAAGVPALLALLGFGLVALRLLAPSRRVAAAAWWTAGVIALYAASLMVLELVQRISPAGLQTDFQRGHSTVSAVWGLCGLALPYAGLTRRPSLRLAGFALFGVSLAKIFLYDLPLAQARRRRDRGPLGARLPARRGRHQGRASSRLQQCDTSDDGQRFALLMSGDWAAARCPGPADSVRPQEERARPQLAPAQAAPTTKLLSPRAR